jgi:hypothetical protein
MERDIKLSGSEISLLKAIGLSGSAIPGRSLLDRAGELDETEFLETLQGLISIGYVLCSRLGIRTREDVEHAFFRVDPSMSRELRDAVSPARRRAREQQRERRQRRG